MGRSTVMVTIFPIIDLLLLPGGEEPNVFNLIKRKPRPRSWFFYGAGDEARTRYLHLGKVALYRMSYTRRNKRYYNSYFQNVNTLFPVFLIIFLLWFIQEMRNPDNRNNPIHIRPYHNRTAKQIFLLQRNAADPNGNTYHHNKRYSSND